MQSFLAYGPASCMAGILAVDAIGGLPGIPPQITSAGVLGVLAWVLWILLARILPAHEAALVAQRKDFLEAIKKDREDDH